MATTKPDAKAKAAAKKKEETAKAKAEAAAKRKAEREAAAQKKAEEKAKAAAERKAERERKAKEKEEAKAKAKAEREANRMPEQNGVRQPKPETTCGKVWANADKLSAKMKQPTPIKDLMEVCTKQKIDPSTTRTQYARWRKFHGVTGRVTAPSKD